MIARLRARVTPRNEDKRARPGAAQREAAARLRNELCLARRQRAKAATREVIWSREKSPGGLSASSRARAHGCSQSARTWSRFRPCAKPGRSIRLGECHGDRARRCGHRARRLRIAACKGFPSEATRTGCKQHERHRSETPALNLNACTRLGVSTRRNSRSRPFSRTRREHRPAVPKRALRAARRAFARPRRPSDLLPRRGEMRGTWTGRGTCGVPRSTRATE